MWSASFSTFRLSIFVVWRLFDVSSFVFRRFLVFLMYGPGSSISCVGRFDLACICCIFVLVLVQSWFPNLFRSYIYLRNHVLRSCVFVLLTIVRSIIGLVAWIRRWRPCAFLRNIDASSQARMIFLGAVFLFCTVFPILRMCSGCSVLVRISCFGDSCSSAVSRSGTSYPHVFSDSPILRARAVEMCMRVAFHFLSSLFFFRFSIVAVGYILFCDSSRQALGFLP